LLDKIKTPQNCPAMTWKMKNENGDGDFDEEMLPVLIQLNNNKWHTVSSCAGHPLSLIEKHNMSYGVNVPYRITVYIHVSNHYIDEFKTMVNELDEASTKYLECSLGHWEDYSNKTEKDFIPFVVSVHAGTKKNRDNYLAKFLTIAKKYNQ
jgi:hypothetical protein